MRPNNRGRALFETLLITSLTGILIVIAISTFIGTLRLAREAALRSELGNIRTAISLYRMLNRQNPKSLQEMVAGRYVLPYREDGMIKRQYLVTASLDKEGRPLDPFGNPFLYDERSGRIISSTEGYESW